MHTNNDARNAATTVPTDAAPPPLLVTIPEAARVLSVSRSTIYELIWQHKLVPVRIGRSVRIRRHDFERFVQGQSQAEPFGDPAAGAESRASAP